MAEGIWLMTDHRRFAISDQPSAMVVFLLL
jgi:hypothetical protein